MSRLAPGCLALLLLFPSIREGAIARGPLTDTEVILLLKSGVSPARLRTLVRRFGVAFSASGGTLESILGAGGDADLIEVLKNSPPPEALPSSAPSPTLASSPSLSPSPSPPGTGRAKSPFEPVMVLIPKGPRGDFYLSRHEVTNREYLAFCRRLGRPNPEAPYWGRPFNFPVVNVSWYDAVTYCNWLSLETGRAYRLPTEAEWEYAAVGGRAQPYPWGHEEPAGRACFGKGAICPVGAFKANMFGLFDMAGNVAEWCQNDFAKNSKEKVIRGGSWAVSAANPEFLTASHRDHFDPNHVRNEIGFRVALSP